MSQMPVEANVVLTADNTAYDQAMVSSADQTEGLGKSIDSLTGKLDKLAKSAGRKLLGFTAADVGVITAATAAYGAFEKQMEGLNAQAAVLNRTASEQERTFNGYTTSVNKLRGTFGMATSEAAALTQTISKLNDGTANVDKLANTFAKLGAVTGESPNALAQGLLQLQKTMGTPQRDTERYANTLTSLAARTNTSAAAITDFAQSIAPVGRMINMTQTEVMGVSQSFIKAGQDGYTAGNAFNKMVSDIAYATQTGSPDLAKYSNLIGVTVDQFKEMNKTEAVVKIFDTLNKQGPAAITTLNRMGLDGMRTMRAITAMSQQTGGIGAGIAQARAAEGDGSLGRGSKAAMDGLADSLKRIRSELAMTAEAFGAKFAGPAKQFLNIVKEIAEELRMVASGPIGDLAAAIMGLAAPFAAIGGTILIAAKALSAFTAGAAVLGSAGVRSFMDSARGTPGATQGRAARPYNWWQRGTAGFGGAVGGVFARDPNADPRTGPSMASRAAAIPVRMSSWGARLIGDSYSPGWGGGLGPGMGPMGRNGLDDPSQRVRMFNPPGGRPDLSSADSRMFGRFGKAVDDAGKQATGFGRAMGGLTRNLGYMGTSIASAGVGAGRVAGRGIGALGSAAYGLVGGNPLLAGAMVGLGGYMAYDSLIKDKSSGAYKDMSGALDPYFAAGGITGPGAVAAPSASTYTPPTTVRGAKTVRNADVVQTGMSTFKLSQPQLNQYKNDPAGATTYLASQFDMMKHNPEALNTLKLDLVKMYGADEAQSILSNLSSGASFDAGQFISRSLNTKGRGDNWFTKSVVYRGDEARADVARPLNQLSSIYEDQYRMANRIQGPEAAMATRARQMMSSVGMFTRQGGLKRLNEKEEEQRGFADFIAKTFQAEGFTGGDLFQRTTDSSFGANTFDAGKGASEQEQYRHFLGQMLPTLTTQGRGKFLGQFGVDRNVENQDAINSIMRLIGGDYSKAGLQADPDSLEARLSKVASGQGVGGVLGSKSFSAALGAEGDVNKQILAVKDLLDSMVEAGKSAPEIEKVLGSFRAEAVEGAQYDLFAAAQEFNRREMGYSMADMSRTEQYGAQRELYRQRMDIPAGDPQAQAQQEQARAEIFQADQEQKNYFIGLLTAQREFNISRRRGEEDFAVQRERMDIQYNLSRERAQTDFNTQRAYQEFDYQLSRRRAEADFERQSERGSEDYYRSLSRQRADYNLSRRRQEQDFNHQVEVMTESAAKNVYNIYDRIQVQRTSSAGYLLANAGEQLEAMRTQSDDLDKLRKAGVSDDVIQQMGLTDAKNAQQLSRFVGDIAEDPNLVKEFNKAVGQRLKAAKGLVTDESSQEWQEFNRQHNLARKRGEADFERSVNRSMADFNRNMNRMNRDFRRSMSEQATDYERATERANIAFDLSMDRAADDYDTSITNMVNDFDKQMGRAADDLDRMSRTISGTMEEILAKSVKKLSGHAKQQAQAVKNEFEGVENSYERVATRIMRNLASIFGVDFKAPKGVSSKGGAAAGNEGGVGGHSTDDDPRTKGRGGGGGGSPQVPLPAGSYVTGYNEWGERNPRYAKGYHTGDDYSAPAGTPILAALAGKVAIAGDGGAYGNYVVIDHGGGLQTLYGHQSHLGVQKGDMVNAGQRIGSVGSTGNSDGNHLHFEVRMNGQDVDPDSLGKFASGKGIGQYGAARPGDVLQNRYEKLERLTAQMSNIHVLQDGDISKIMNRFGRAAIQRMEQQSGTSLGAAAGASGNVHVGDFEVPSNVKGNVALGKKMAADLKGWKGDQWSALYRLWTAESGWRTNADNPTSSAYGIPQALIALHNMPKGYSDYTRGSGKYTEGFGGDPRVQIGWGLNYIAGSYGDPKSAWGFHQRNNWYGEGAIFDGGAQTIGVGERGAEIVMPLDRKGVDFLAALMERVSPGLDGRNTNTGGYSQPICAHTVNTYQIDRSTSFTGPITVQANDPNQFIGELRNRERARALSQAAIGGRRV